MTDQVSPTFDEFAKFLRKKTGVKDNFPIMPVTLFEDDLGVTGDEGGELLEAVEKQYGISLLPLSNLLALQPNEYLFHDEGFGIDFLALGRFVRNLSSTDKEPKPTVRAFRVGELYDAVCQLIAKKA